ncbi:Flagellar biosynthesis protein, FliO [Alkalithermobacter thermoalcaliphilus JW-YL-7 = DSM 7308]|uniref:Flagellar biosynthesis protein, FliO n=1 Tax=Alkalithermobacter thermoalcaliphilus JW-YL-7 = DSM 7308 TaxID=1121328 RepID=A0A150FRX4_CLOPD|nr:hypothetical protein JWYL7_0855 [[Clostridium] paradoxum JW-YL-7 = DSM 7308]SHK60865.1 Flagellar biosynthesis protein, FliO [[Clostridium] paradoxum JW-YL-7 = DSM 7308]
MNTLYIIFRIISYLCIFILVIYFINLTSKYLIKKNNDIMKNKKIKIVERFYLGKDKEIILVNYKKYEYIIGVSQNCFSTIDRLIIEDDTNEKS